MTQAPSDSDQLVIDSQKMEQQTEMSFSQALSGL